MFFEFKQFYLFTRLSILIFLKSVFIIAPLKLKLLTIRFSQRLGQFGGFGNWRIFEGNAKSKGTAL